MAKKEKTPAFDWALVGKNVHRFRTLSGESRADLARSAGVGTSTVYQAEQGLPISRRSLQKIAEAMEMSLELFSMPSQTPLVPDMRAIVHRHRTGLWTTFEDTRSKRPEDNFALIQDPEERLRLGRLGLVSAFCTTTSFIMPDGPGMVQLEIFQRIGCINARIYRDCMLTCVRGGFRLLVADEIFELEEGDVVGYRTEELQWLEPITPIGTNGLPVLATWVGAVRVGGLA